MPYLNDCKIMGHAGREAELSYSQNGVAICKFSIAVSRGKDKETDWFNVTCFNKTAEIAAENVQKGSLVLCSGSMQSNKYQEKTYWNFIANRIYNLDRKGEGQSKSKADDEWGKIGKEIDLSDGDDSEVIPF